MKRKVLGFVNLPFSPERRPRSAALGLGVIPTDSPTTISIRQDEHWLPFRMNQQEPFSTRVTHPALEFDTAVGYFSSFSGFLSENNNTFVFITAPKSREELGRHGPATHPIGKARLERYDNRELNPTVGIPKPIGSRETRYCNMGKYIDSGFSQKWSVRIGWRGQRYSWRYPRYNNGGKRPGIRCPGTLLQYWRSSSRAVNLK